MTVNLLTKLHLPYRKTHQVIALINSLAKEVKKLPELQPKVKRIGI